MERVGWQKAAVALANKNARILWAVMTRGEAFDASSLRAREHAAVTENDSTTNFLATRENEDALNRSDRRRAGSTNLGGTRSAVTRDRNGGAGCARRSRTCWPWA